MAVVALILAYTLGLGVLGGLIGLAVAKPSTRRATVPAAVALGVVLAILPALLCLGMLLAFELPGPG